MFRAVSIEEINQLSKNSLIEHLSIEFIEIGDDFMSATMPVNASTHQPMGYLHGGASIALAETLGSMASLLLIDPEKYSVFGISVSANHVKSKKEGLVTAFARPMNIGSKIHLWDIEIKDEEMKLISAVRLTNMVVEKRKV